MRLARRARRARRGGALPFVLVLLAVGSALAAGAAAAVRGTSRASRLAPATLQARAAAEGALATILARWPPAWSLALGVGDPRTLAVRTPAGGARVGVVRLDSNRFALRASAEARAPLPGAHARAARATLAIVRLRRVRIDPPAALVAGGAVHAAAGARLDGGDVAPDGWSDCVSHAPRAALAVADARDADGVEPPLGATGGVTVTPAARATATHETLGDETWSALARRADVSLMAGGVHQPLPRAAGGECVLDATSWGEPWRGAGTVAACRDVAAVVHVAGDGVTRLRGPARVQGIVLVDGDLVVEGPVHVAGALLVRGSLVADALQIDGALLVRAGPGVTGVAGRVTLGDGVRVRWSSCAVARASLAASRPIALGRRDRADVTPHLRP